MSTLIRGRGSDLREPRRSTDMTRRRQIIAALLGLLVVVIAGVLYLKRVSRQVGDAYAGLNTSVLIIQFLEAHEGRWPRSWDDLDAPPREIEYLRELVAVDWSIDVAAISEQLRRGEDVSLNAIRPIEEDAFFWGSPNERVLDHLRASLANSRASNATQ